MKGRFIKNFFRIFFLIFVTAFFACGRFQKEEAARISVSADKGEGGMPLPEARSVPNFVSGVMFHNALPTFTMDELAAARGAGIFLVDPAAEQIISHVGPDSSGGGPGNIRTLAVKAEGEKVELWAGTLFDGAYVLELPEGEVKAHYTVENTGLVGTAEVRTPQKMIFHPHPPLSASEISDLSLRLATGLYLRLNTETFQVASVNWPEVSVYTYPGSHDLFHAAGRGEGLNQAVILTGLSDNTVNQILVEGDTVWLATGFMADKGLAGGVDFFRGGKRGSHPPDSVFNTRHRFHWQRSNAALSLCLRDGRLWSGWAELRGLKPWGGVSGNLLYFRRRGEKTEEWKDFTRPIGVDAEGFSQILHVSVPALAPLVFRRGKTTEQCVAAATAGMNNTLAGMGNPRRVAAGGGGLRIICEGGLVGLITKSFRDGQPVPGGPSSNAVFSLAAASLPESNEVYAVAGTDAGLYVAELSSQLREYFYQAPSSPRPVVNIGSNFLLGRERRGEVLHGMTVGSETWPPCLPDLRVQEVFLDSPVSAEKTVIWAATFGGLARYEGPLTEGGLKDCGRWSWFCLAAETAGAFHFRRCSEAEMKSGFSGRMLPVSVVRPLKFRGRELLLLGTGLKWFEPGAGAALEKIMAETSGAFPQRPLTHVRVLYSTFYEDLHENLIFPDAAAINLYTEKFHRRTCSIAQPACLAGDTALNWKHLDDMVDRMVALDLTPTFCPSTFPFLIHRDLVPQKGARCAPPDPTAPECAPSRAAWDFRKWENLVFALVDHFYSRYGRARVARWTLEVWNEPAISWLWPWEKSWAEDYVLLYEHTRKAVQACNAWWDETRPATRGLRLRLAGPAWHGDPTFPDERLEKVLSLLCRRSLQPDLITFHIYPFAGMDMTPWYEAGLKQTRSAGFSETPFAVTEYGMVMAHSADGIGTSAGSEMPALFLLKSLPGLSRTSSPPEMMYALDIQSPGGGTRSNWPGLLGYLGTMEAAPRPVFNLMVLAAQAGEIPLEVKTRGEVEAFARLEPRTGQIMVFAYRTSAKVPWKETIDYHRRGQEPIQMKIDGLSVGYYWIREFKIDGAHSNLLAAIWRAGSPDQPSPDTAKKIREAAVLRPLEEREKPNFIKGDSFLTGLTMEDDSIYVAELTPPPVIASAPEISDPSVTVGEHGVTKVNWQQGPRRYRRVYQPQTRKWNEIEAEADRPADKGCSSDLSRPCAFSVQFNGKKINLALRREDGGKTILALAEEKFILRPELFRVDDWDGGNLAFTASNDGAIHLVHAYGGGPAGLWYQKYVPLLLREEGGQWDLRYVGLAPRPVNLSPPYPAGNSPCSPAVAVDAAGGVHIVWLGMIPHLFESPRRTVFYTYLRR